MSKLQTWWAGENWLPTCTAHDLFQIYTYTIRIVHVSDLVEQEALIWYIYLLSGYAKEATKLAGWLEQSAKEIGRYNGTHFKHWIEWIRLWQSALQFAVNIYVRRYWLCCVFPCVWSRLIRICAARKVGIKKCCRRFQTRLSMDGSIDRSIAGLGKGKKKKKKKY